jgi:hypothetical protein
VDISSLTDFILQMDERQQRLFACDCVDRILYLIEKKNPKELRPRRTVEAARQYAEG